MNHLGVASYCGAIDDITGWDMHSSHVVGGGQLTPKVKIPAVEEAYSLKKLWLISIFNNLFSAHSHMMQCFLARPEQPKFSLV